MDVIKTQQISARPIEKVIVHPLVLLSIVDNYNRVAKDTRKRVVGVLLGTSFKGTVDVTNSYAGSFFYILCFYFNFSFRLDLNFFFFFLINWVIESKICSSNSTLRSIPDLFVFLLKIGSRGIDIFVKFQFFHE